jgi:hypothetical protein
MGDTDVFTATNTGGAPTGPIKVALTGTGRKAFVVVDDQCGGQVLAPAATCTISIQFQPTARAAQTAALGVSATPGGTASASLGGVGLTPATLTGDATTLDFGTVDVTQSGLAQVWTVTNTGDVVSGTLSTTLSGDVAEFMVTDGCMTKTLDPGKSCTVSLVLAPASGGMKSLTVSVAATPGGSPSVMAQGTGRPLDPLTVTIQGTGTGGVQAMPTGLDCGAGCMSYVYGTPVMLAATPDVSSDFTGWGGACNGTGPCFVTMTTMQDVTATFTLRTIMLTATVSGSGTVKSTPDGLSCGDSCHAGFDYGTPVSVKATPAQGWAFSSWTSCPSADRDTCSVTLTQTTDITANFVRQDIPTTIDVTGSGTVSWGQNMTCTTTGCMTTFPYGLPVMLTATPALNHHFMGWSGACSGMSSTCMFTPGITSVNVGASFAIDTYVLTVNDGTGGSVSSMPAGLSCASGTCMASFDYGTQVSLTPKAGNNYAFLSWGQDCSGNGTCSVTMTQAHAVAVNFTPTYLLTVARVTGGRVQGNGIDCGTTTMACTSTLSSGTAVSLKATADPTYRVDTWMGCSDNSANPCTLTLNGPAMVTPKFQPQYLLKVYPTPVGGTVTGPNGLSCGTSGGPCSVWVDANSPVSLTAMKDSTYRLGTWTGCAPNAAGDMCSIAMMTGPVTVSQTFVQQFKVTVTPSPAGGVVSGNGITCGDQMLPCQVTLDANTPVSLTAAADNGYRWGTWTGCSDNNANPCTFTLTADTMVSQTFVRQHKITVTSPAGGYVTGPTGTISCGQGGGTVCVWWYDATSSVTLTANTYNGSTIGSWGSDCQVNYANPTCVLSMSTDHTASITFNYVVTAIANYGGSVGVSLAGGTPNNCSKGCAFAAGSSVTVVPTPQTYWLFASYVGACAGQSGNCPLTVNANYSTTVSFKAQQATLYNGLWNGRAAQTPIARGGTVTFTGYAGSTSAASMNPVTYTCSGTTGSCALAPTAVLRFDVGTTVTATETPDTGYFFNGWYGAGTPGGADANGAVTIYIQSFGTASQTTQYRWICGINPIRVCSAPDPPADQVPYPQYNWIGAAFGLIPQ